MDARKISMLNQSNSINAVLEMRRYFEGQFSFGSLREETARVLQQQEIYNDVYKNACKIAMSQKFDFTRDLGGKALREAAIGVFQQQKNYNNDFKNVRQMAVFSKIDLMKDLVAEHQESRKRILETIRDSFDFQKMNTEFVSKCNWHDTLQSLNKALDGFEPTVKPLENAIVIDQEEFNQEQICQIVNDYILDGNSSSNIFVQGSEKGFWESIPKPVRCVIWLIISFHIFAFWNGMTKDTVFSLGNIERMVTDGRDKIFKQFRKLYTDRPFVDYEKLKVYASPNRKSYVIADLSKWQDIEILKSKKKKRWILIEWEDSLGNKNSGWVLGRFICKD